MTISIFFSVFRFFLSVCLRVDDRRGCLDGDGVVSGVEGGRYFFSTVREGDQIMFATDDESERTLWVQAVYRATGQSHKPVPPTNQPQRTSNTQLSKVQGGLSVFITDRRQRVNVTKISTNM